jgi:hypothetical protein
MLYHPAGRSATGAREASSCQLLAVARAVMTRQRWAIMVPLRVTLRASWRNQPNLQKIGGSAWVS